MLLQTKHFGEIEYRIEEIISFDSGLVAFQDYRHYLIIKRNDQDVPLDWLQCLDNSELAFVIMDPFFFKPDYDFELSPEDLDELGIEDAQDVVVFSIVVVPEDLRKMTANLVAPIIVNSRTRRAKQVVLQDKRYSTRHNILEELQKYRQGGF